ncbi:hypothetical protein [Streptomyces sp. NBC_01443]|uniref:hypothetical protein n=1 Tax=Streptomyces sp. NBC_01443 TaxID=2903868 RepID=UPI002257AF31|nr:hypothetical protein [Streptomyces sp. NBC_01443]MCX4633455.1 hypothetical protein [Streptomyces sp. NBC_01443]
MSDPLLSYALETDPDPFPVGGTATLRLTARGGARPAYCKRIVVAVPTGAGTGELTTAPGSLVPAVTGGDAADQGGGWDVALTTPPGEAVFTLTPRDGRGWLAGVTPLTFTLGQVRVNTATGTARLRITEETSADGTAWATPEADLPVPKFPEGFVFRDLRAKQPHVNNGDRVTLTWEGSPATYTMDWGRRPVEVTEDGTWTSPSLHNTTVFRLAATLPGTTAERVLTTMVTVARPHLRLTDLRADGRIRRFGTSRPLAAPSPGALARYTAPTDGVLLGHVRARNGGEPASLRVTVLTDDTPVYGQRFVSDNRDRDRLPSETPFHLPVSEGCTVVVTAEGSADDDFGLTWMPYGNGPLVPRE